MQWTISNVNLTVFKFSKYLLRAGILFGLVGCSREKIMVGCGMVVWLDKVARRPLFQPEKDTAQNSKSESPKHCASARIQKPSDH